MMASKLFRLPSWISSNPYGEVGQYLLSHGLTCGVGEYWNASSVTALSDGRVVVRAVLGGPHGPLVPFLWASDEHWYAQMAHPTFAIWRTGEENWFHVNAETVSATYGKPARIDEVLGFSIAYLPGSTCEGEKAE